MLTLLRHVIGNILESAGPATSESVGSGSQDHSVGAGCSSTEKPPKIRKATDNSCEGDG